MKRSKNPDPYAIQTETPAKSASPGAAPSDAGGVSELFSTTVVDGAHVITFSRSDVVDAQYIKRVGDDIYHHLKPVDAPRVVLNLHNVNFLSSSAIGMLVALKTVVAKKNGKICLANVDDNIGQVFKITKMHKIMKIHDSIDKAIESIR